MDDLLGLKWNVCYCPVQKHLCVWHLLCSNRGYTHTFTMHYIISEVLSNGVACGSAPHLLLRHQMAHKEFVTWFPERGRLFGAICSIKVMGFALKDWKVQLNWSSSRCARWNWIYFLFFLWVIQDFKFIICGQRENLSCPGHFPP